MAADLLPPNASALERALAQATARAGDVPVPVEALWDPATCPVDLLPWLAWSLSIDRWDTGWSVDQRRAAVADAIAQQRIKGSRASMEDLLAGFDPGIRVVEWFETAPRGRPHTFEVRLPLLDAGDVIEGRRYTRAWVDTLATEIDKTKPARAHYTIAQRLEVAGTPAPFLAARAATYRRLDGAAAPAPIAWGDLLQTETGEPIEDDAGTMIDGTAP